MMRSTHTYTAFLSALLSVFLLAALVPPAHAQDRARQEREVPAFDALAMSVRGTAYVRQGNTHSLELDGPQEILDKVKTNVENGRLTVEYEGEGFLDRLSEWFRGKDKSVDVYVTMPSVRELTVAGMGRIEGETPIETERLTTGISGMGEMTLEVSTQHLDTYISGAGEMTLSGQAKRHAVQISGAGELRARDLESLETRIAVSGAGECEVFATETLDVAISGAGDVRYRGTPQISQSISGAGSVEAL